MNLKKLISGRALVIASFALFCIGLMTGWTWWDQQTLQTKYYLLGRTAYITTQYETSVDYFNRSFSEYVDGMREPDSSFKAPPSLEMAELSQHFKALALVKMGNAKLAVLSYKDALKLTTDYALGIAAVQLKLTPAQLDKLRADRKTTQIDFEILFRHKPQLAKAEGKGKGKGEDSEKQSEDPSNQAGKTDRDKL